MKAVRGCVRGLNLVFDISIVGTEVGKMLEMT
jgi:hypothetical protein